MGAFEWATYIDNPLIIRTGFAEHLVAVYDSSKPLCLFSSQNRRGLPSEPSQKTAMELSSF